ncbi:hypothetical protein FZEAL_3758 [Fusarium zealandicum]|uniref:Sodium/calcium exchanger membrane region domain-containing protein n=1 Tax=Fusarium zealandicum TaxID=1053134 RepID=A0A8H4UN25_9HYPO|nr:hypothetical protein FZEAL_3758 [Fusarium zealandicum]
MSSLVSEAPRYNDCSASSASEDEDDSASRLRPLGAQEASSSHQVTGLLRDTVKRALRASSRFGDGFRYQQLGAQGAPDIETPPPEPGFAFNAGGDVGPTFWGQIRATFVSSRLNWLLVFVPIGLATHMLEASPLLTFITNAIAIVPLSAMLTDATERIAVEAGDTIGALLNITLGNLVELIILVALVNNHIRIVQASILGSVLVNLLLILGSALLASSMANHDAQCSMEESELLACLLFISVFVILIPTAFDYTFHKQGGSDKAALSMSRASSLVVLVIYVLYFAYEMRSKPAAAAGPIPLQTLRPSSSHHSTDPQRHRGQNSSSQSAHGPRIIRFADQDADKHSGRASLDGDDDGHNHDVLFDSRTTSYQQDFRARAHSRSRSLSASQAYHGMDSSSSGPGLSRHISHERSFDISPQQSHYPSSRSGTLASVTILVLTSAIMSLNAEFLVKTIDDVTHEGGLSEAMIGLIILPVVGNIAEYVTVVTVATKNKLDLAISVAVGSAIQIALCVAPLTVLIAWMLNRDLEMAFNVFETTTLVGTGLMINVLILSRASTTVNAIGLKGALMYACYIIIGLGAYFEPHAKK